MEGCVSVLRNVSTFMMCMMMQSHVDAHVVGMPTRCFNDVYVRPISRTEAILA